jgi:hypothetical protein
LYWNTSLLTESFALEYFYWLNILHRNISTGWIVCTGMSWLAEYFVLEYSYWLNTLYCKIPTGWIFCTGIHRSRRGRWPLGDRREPAEKFASQFSTPRHTVDQGLLWE